MDTLIYEEIPYQEFLERINQLTSQTKPKWGKMNVAQMMAHCAAAQEVLNGDKELKGVPFYVRIFSFFIRKLVLSKKPYKEGIQTAQQYKFASNIDFEESKTQLLNAMERFKNQSREESEAAIHALFGKLTREEKGWAAYKHIDHHFKQFGV